MACCVQLLELGSSKSYCADAHRSRLPCFVACMYGADDIEQKALITHSGAHQERQATLPGLDYPKPHIIPVCADSHPICVCVCVGCPLFLQPCRSPVDCGACGALWCPVTTSSSQVCVQIDIQRGAVADPSLTHQLIAHQHINVWLDCRQQ